MGLSSPIKTGSTKSIHAEEDAMRKFSKLAKYRRFIKKGGNVDILIFRLSRTGNLGNSKPCKNCAMHLSKYEFNVNNVYYSNSEGEIVCEKLRDITQSDIRMSYGDRVKKRSNPKKITKKERRRLRRLRKKMKYSSSKSSNSDTSSTNSNTSSTKSNTSSNKKQNKKSRLKYKTRND